MLPKLTSSGGYIQGLNGIDHRGIVASQLLRTTDLSEK